MTFNSCLGSACADDGVRPSGLRIGYKRCNRCKKRSGGGPARSDGGKRKALFVHGVKS